MYIFAPRLAEKCFLCKLVKTFSLKLYFSTETFRNNVSAYSVYIKTIHS